MLKNSTLTTSFILKNEKKKKSLRLSQSLADTHYSLLRPSSFVPLPTGEMKRRRTKLNYLDIYLEKKNYVDYIVGKRRKKNIMSKTMNITHTDFYKKYNIKKPNACLKKRVLFYSFDERENKQNYFSCNETSINDIEIEKSNKKDVNEIYEKSRNDTGGKKHYYVEIQSKTTIDLGKFLTKGIKNKRFISFDDLVKKNENNLREKEIFEKANIEQNEMNQRKNYQSNLNKIKMQAINNKNWFLNKSEDKNEEINYIAINNKSIEIKKDQFIKPEGESIRFVKLSEINDHLFENKALLNKAENSNTEISNDNKIEQIKGIKIKINKKVFKEKSNNNSKEEENYLITESDKKSEYKNNVETENINENIEQIAQDFISDIIYQANNELQSDANYNIRINKIARDFIESIFQDAKRNNINLYHTKDESINNILDSSATIVSDFVSDIFKYAEIDNLKQKLSNKNKKSKKETGTKKKNQIIKKYKEPDPNVIEEEPLKILKKNNKNKKLTKMNGMDNSYDEENNDESPDHFSNNSIEETDQQNEESFSKEVPHDIHPNKHKEKEKIINNDKSKRNSREPKVDIKSEKFTFNTEDEKESTLVNYIDEVNSTNKVSSIENNKKNKEELKPQKKKSIIPKTNTQRIKRYNSMCVNPSGGKALKNTLGKIMKKNDKTKKNPKIQNKKNEKELLSKEDVESREDDDDESDKMSMMSTRRMSARLNSYRHSIMVVGEKLKKKEIEKKKSKVIPKFNETEYQIRKRKKSMGAFPGLENKIEEFHKLMFENNGKKNQSLTARDIKSGKKIMRRSSMGDIGRRPRNPILKDNNNNKINSKAKDNTDNGNNTNSVKTKNNELNSQQTQNDKEYIENQYNDNNELNTDMKEQGKTNHNKNINENSNMENKQNLILLENKIAQNYEENNINIDEGNENKLRKRNIQSINDIPRNPKKTGDESIEAFNEGFNTKNIYNNENNINNIKEIPLGYLNQNYINFNRNNNHSASKKDFSNENSIKMFSKNSYPSPIPNAACSGDNYCSPKHNLSNNSQNIEEDEFSDDKINRLFYKLFSKVKDQNYFIQQYSDRSNNNLARSQSTPFLYQKQKNTFNQMKNNNEYSSNYNNIEAEIEKRQKIKQNFCQLQNLINDNNNSAYQRNNSKKKELKEKFKKLQRENEKQKYKMALNITNKNSQIKSKFNQIDFLSPEYQNNEGNQSSRSYRSRSSSNQNYKHISKYIYNDQYNNVNNANMIQEGKLFSLSTSRSFKNIHNNSNRDFLFNNCINKYAARNESNIDQNYHLNQLKNELYLYEQSKEQKRKASNINDKNDFSNLYFFQQKNTKICPPNAMDVDKFDYFKC